MMSYSPLFGEDHQTFQEVSYKIPQKRLGKKTMQSQNKKKALSIIRNGTRKNIRKKKNH